MTEITQSEWLTDLWSIMYNDESVSRYSALKYAAAVRGRAETMPRERLKYLRNQFITDHVKRCKYPKSRTCFTCHMDEDQLNLKGRFLIRHHIIALSRWGSKFG